MRATLTANENQFDIAIIDDVQEVVLRTSITGGKLTEVKLNRIVQTMNDAFALMAAQAPPADPTDRLAKLERARDRALNDIAARNENLAAIEAELGALKDTESVQPTPQVVGGQVIERNEQQEARDV